MMRTYSELVSLPTFAERLEYLRLNGTVAKETFGQERYLNQRFYASQEWQRIRRDIILRDNACDLAAEGCTIYGRKRVIIHHLNPITIEDVLNLSDRLLNPENMVCTTLSTHNAIHYGDDSMLAVTFRPREKNDTCPWKQVRQNIRG